MLRKHQIPPLAFGEALAKTETSVLRMQAMVAEIYGWDAEYEALGKHNQFITKTTSIDLNDLTITALSHTSIRTKVTATSKSQLFVPIYGSAIQSEVNGKSFTIDAGLGALYTPPGERIGIGGNRSIVIFDFDFERLENTAKTIQGQNDNQTFAFNREEPYQFDFRTTPIPLFQMLKNELACIDTMIAYPSILKKSGRDDTLYRFMAFLFWSKELGVTCDMTVQTDRIDYVCDYILAHLNDTITLTELENIAGVSRRTLQNAFKEKFNCTPMQWVKEQRLLAVRKRLENAHSKEKILAIAYEYGLITPRFAAEYRARFGELPSETRAISNKTS